MYLIKISGLKLTGKCVQTRMLKKLLKNEGEKILRSTNFQYLPTSYTFQWNINQLFEIQVGYITLPKKQINK